MLFYSRYAVKLRVFIEKKNILSLQIGFNVPLKDSKYKTSEQGFQNVPFSAIGYSFATKVLHTGQRNYQGKFTSEWRIEHASEWVSEFAVVFKKERKKTIDYVTRKSHNQKSIGWLKPVRRTYHFFSFWFRTSQKNQHVFFSRLTACCSSSAIKVRWIFTALIYFPLNSFSPKWTCYPRNLIAQFFKALKQFR